MCCVIKSYCHCDSFLNVLHSFCVQLAGRTSIIYEWSYFFQYHIGISLFLNPRTIRGFSLYNKKQPNLFPGCFFMQRQAPTNNGSVSNGYACEYRFPYRKNKIFCEQHKSLRFSLYMLRPGLCGLSHKSDQELKYSPQKPIGSPGRNDSSGLSVSDGRDRHWGRRSSSDNPLISCRTALSCAS